MRKERKIRLINESVPHVICRNNYSQETGRNSGFYLGHECKKLLVMELPGGNLHGSNESFKNTMAEVSLKCTQKPLPFSMVNTYIQKYESSFNGATIINLQSIWKTLNSS